MAVTASDTGNQFADAWNTAESAVTANAPAAAPEGASQGEQDYTSAWNGENTGVYGDINVGTPTPVTAATPSDATATAPAFVQQESWNRWDNPSADKIIATPAGIGQGVGNIKSLGSYGSFKYGDKPERGTQAWRDMSEYIAMGGKDPEGYLSNVAYQQSWDRPAINQEPSGGA